MPRRAMVAGLLVVLVAITGCLSGGGTQGTIDERLQEGASPGIQLPVRAPNSTNQVWVNVTRDRIIPRTAEVGPGRLVGWRNTNRFPVSLAFPWRERPFVIEAGGTWSMALAGETSYEVYRDDTGELIDQGRIIPG